MVTYKERQTRLTCPGVGTDHGEGSSMAAGSFCLFWTPFAVGMETRRQVEPSSELRVEEDIGSGTLCPA